MNCCGKGKGEDDRVEQKNPGKKVIYGKIKASYPLILDLQAFEISFL